MQVLSYHVIPTAAVRSSALRDGQNVTTALTGADPLTVSISDGAVEFVGAQDSATVTTPDIVAGRSVIHVIDDVLLPAGVGEEAAAAANETTTGGVAGASGTATTAPGNAREVDPNVAVGGGASAPAAAAPASSSAAVAKVPAVFLAAAMLFGMLL